MKIVFLARTLNRGGAQRQLLVLAEGLQARGHDVHVIAFYAHGALEQSFRAAAIPVHILHRKNRWDLYSVWRQLVTLVQQIDPEIIHGYLETPNIFAALLQRRTKRARAVFGIRASRIDYMQYDWVIRLMNWLEACAANKTALIIANSQAGATNAIREGFPAHKIVVIYNGINTQKFYPDPAAGQQLRVQWQIEKAQPLIGLVGRLDPKKDHYTFLAAAAEIKKMRAGVRFVCIGEGDKNYWLRLQQHASELGLNEIVQWLPATDDMTAVYNALDILCLPSAFGEGFANVIGEAMACGVPCVATNIGDAAYIIGELGIIVPPKNPAALAAGLLQCLDSGYKERGARIRARICANFSTQKLVDETEAALQKII